MERWRGWVDWVVELTSKLHITELESAVEERSTAAQRTCAKARSPVAGLKSAE